MRQITLPESDHGMAAVVRDAIASGEAVTIVEGGRPVLDLVPRRASWARFGQTTPEERTAAGSAMDQIRANVRKKLTIQEIISSKHEGHRY
ncbi:MAG TPA: hypothetical protein VHY37_13610 [Tepidisphaeraceae bacterium]|jgi:antitoxin (DNA-binding transcriptional repressor) of toxin-antitoxin stability system|nr:hypothetical protein [Tepidisphaeraceae bacterium]